MRYVVPTIVLLLLAGLAPSETAVAPVEAARGASRAEVQGVTISCPGSGRIWGSDAMVTTMERLASIGVNWVAIHPYAGIRADGTVGGSRMSRMYADSTWMTRPIEEAHRLGLKIMVKPHLAHWGSPFSWRGAIAFETEAQWSRFFESYERWIIEVAEICADADAFVVGTELDRTVHHEQPWRRIITSVRGVTDAPLTFASNWDCYTSVPFWDALDVIGIQAYFPLATEQQEATPEQIRDAWKRLRTQLEQYARTEGKSILFSELGYDRSPHAAHRPWEPRRRGQAMDEPLQQVCLEAALRSIAESDSIIGAFLWKWFPGELERSNFLMSTPAMQQVIRRHWQRQPSSPATDQADQAD